MVLLASFASFAGCVGELTEEGPCTPAQECRVGFECVQDFCIKCVEGGCGGLVSGTVGQDESTLCGPDQACISFPRDALDQPTEIFIRRSPVEPDSNLEPRSLVYEIGPANVRIREPATVRIPISPSNPINDIAVHRADDANAAWNRLDSSPGPEFIDAMTSDLGFFVAARER